MAALRDADNRLVETFIGVGREESRVTLVPGLVSNMACRGERFFCSIHESLAKGLGRVK